MQIKADFVKNLANQYQVSPSAAPSAERRDVQVCPHIDFCQMECSSNANDTTC